VMCVCVCVCVVNSLGGLHIDNKLGRSSCDKYCSTSLLQASVRHNRMHSGTVQYATFSAICTVGLRAICGKINVRWGLPSVERVNVAARGRERTLYRALVSGIN